MPKLYCYSDCDGVYVGELGSPTLKLLGCSSRHAKLVN